MAIKDSQDLALPKGSLILVTGASGYIGSNIVRECLDAGYRVRGTVRSEDKANKTKDIFKSTDYETAIVADMQHDDSFDEAVKSVDAIIHSASVLTFSANPHEVIPPVVAGAISILSSAIKEPKVKSFVYTSSSTACTEPKPNKKFYIDKNMWNHESDYIADAKPPYSEDKAFTVYSCSKYRAERAVWKFVEDHKPSFTVNCVLPNFNMGRILDVPASTSKMITEAYQGNVNWDFPPQYMINVVDCARLHLLAAIDKTVTNERILAFDEPFNWSDVIECLHELRPNAKLPATRPDEHRDLSEVDNAIGARLLKKWYGQDGYLGFKESMKQNMEGIA